MTRPVPVLRRLARPFALAAVLALQGCVVVPRTTEVYDVDCRIYARQMVLEVTQVGVLGRCSNRECAAALAAMGVVTAATAVVSGSIVVAGNIVYWFEKQGRCER